MTVIVVTVITRSLQYASTSTATANTKFSALFLSYIKSSKEILDFLDCEY
jgi:hypothetical protein